jgi:WD40 repeat protein
MAVQLWDLDEGTQKRRLKGVTDNLVCVALTPNGRRAAAGSREGTVYVWALDRAGTGPLALTGHAGTVTGVAFTADGMAILSVGLDGTLRHWTGKFRGGQVLLHGSAGAIQALACADEVVALAGDRLVLYRPDDELRALTGHEGGTTCVAFTADGKTLVSGGRDGVVRVWRTSDGAAVGAFEGHAGSVRAVAVSADGRLAYSGGSDGTLRRWPVRPAGA